MSRTPLRPRTAYRHFAPISTRWHDNDVYGHVNNVVYYGWFDTAVNAWLIDNGLLQIEGGNPIGLVVETGCRYAAPVAFPQRIEIGVTVARLGSSSVTYHLGVFVEGIDEAAAEGHFTHVYVDARTRRPTPLPEAWRAVLLTIASDQSA
ncbi:acyl-CoA thioesterase [Novosphingobium sp. ERN07]|uniref:acyl-CoA thioesterase n=1 Tax=Novosphingobium sp. ERN07 TaxID=2726187 RepID=UPI0014573668|nr:thioesterase family protein [Novosphingobium sp. ERN07]NLR72015.1 acyl-CoA thioesterase [Novosphingobium sp. ERN07]